MANFQNIVMHSEMVMGLITKMSTDFKNKIKKTGDPRSEKRNPLGIFR